jgi:O-antigen/teichoic acid export membrane protein
VNENADYAAAYRFLDALQFIPATIASVLLPLLSVTAVVNPGDGAARLSRLFQLGLKFLVAAALPLAVGTAMLSGQLVTVVYGANFEASAPLLTVLIWSFLSICIGYLVVSLSLALNQTRRYAIVTALAAGFNIAANWILIPRYGAAAACWITVITEYSVSLSLLFLLVRSSGIGVPWGSWLRVGLAAAGMAPVVYVLRDAGIYAPVVAGALAYLFLILVLRVISKEDIRVLLSREAVA